MRSLGSAMIGFGVASLAVASTACWWGGQCPWSSPSAVEIAPATACLELRIGPKQPNVACPAVELVGKNSCAGPLVFVFPDSNLWPSDATFAPGEAVNLAFDSPLAAAAVYPGGFEILVEGERSTWTVPATLDSEAITLRWSLIRD